MCPLVKGIRLVESIRPWSKVFVPGRKYSPLVESIRP